MKGIISTVPQLRREAFELFYFQDERESGA
jgi:hypothetical protein